MDQKYEKSGLASSRDQLANVLPSDWNELSDAAKMSWCFYQSFTSDYPSVCDDILRGDSGSGQLPDGYVPPQQMGMSSAAVWIIGAAGLGMLGMAILNQQKED